MWNDLMDLGVSVPDKVLRTIAVYVVLLVLIRLAGKRDLAELNSMDLVVMLLLSCMLIPFQATIIPAYLITSWLGVLDTWLGVALPLLSTIICIFIFKASFESVPRSLIDAARVDGLGEWRIVTRILLPLSKSAIATNVILTFIWSWNSFLWPLIAIRTPDMQTLPLGLARFLSVMEDTTGALYAFVVLVLIPGLAIFLMAQKEFIRGLTSGATKG